jgi:hypothetical protein
LNIIKSFTSETMRKLILILSFLPLLSCSWLGIEEKEAAEKPDAGAEAFSAATAAPAGEIPEPPVEVPAEETPEEEIPAEA